jgi:hypothetical protein
VQTRRKEQDGSRAPDAIEFYLVAQLVNLDTEAIEFDLVLPIVAGGHFLGRHGGTGLDELEEHAYYELFEAD